VLPLRLTENKTPNTETDVNTLLAVIANQKATIKDQSATIFALKLRLAVLNPVVEADTPVSEEAHVTDELDANAQAFEEIWKGILKTHVRMSMQLAFAIEGAKGIAAKYQDLCAGEAAKHKMFMEVLVELRPEFAAYIATEDECDAVEG
jgi:hypothetical protein